MGLGGGFKLFALVGMFAKIILDYRKKIEEDKQEEKKKYHKKKKNEKAEERREGYRYIQCSYLCVSVI